MRLKVLKDTRPHACLSCEYCCYSEMNEKGEILIKCNLEQGVKCLDERPHGKWIPSPITCEDFVCSECGGGCWYYDASKYVAKSNFCPNCGADMRSNEDGK